MNILAILGKGLLWVIGSPGLLVMAVVWVIAQILTLLVLVAPEYILGFFMKHRKIEPAKKDEATSRDDEVVVKVEKSAQYASPPVEIRKAILEIVKEPSYLAWFLFAYRGELYSQRLRRNRQEWYNRQSPERRRFIDSIRISEIIPGTPDAESFLEQAPDVLLGYDAVREAERVAKRHDDGGSGT